jgi:competence ComEA-like helix-hairpin-helix protein
VNFRNKLGGFYSIDQVGETFGLADSTFQKIKPYLRLGDSTVRKFNINTASIDELKTHPYIRWQIANAIVAYRQEHGVFTKIEDIQKVMAVTPGDYKKFSRYIEVQ